MMMSPWIAPLRYSLMKLVKFKTFPMVESRTAPTTVPHTCPEPPLRAVPPMMTAAMASSSHNSPVPAFADPS